MEETCKFISGLRKAGSFTISKRHKIIQDAMTSGRSKVEIWKKYTGRMLSECFIITSI